MLNTLKALKGLSTTFNLNKFETFFYYVPLTSEMSRQNSDENMKKDKYNTVMHVLYFYFIQVVQTQAKQLRGDMNMDNKIIFKTRLNAFDKQFKSRLTNLDMICNTCFGDSLNTILLINEKR